MIETPDSLRKQARQILSLGKPPRIALTELRSWASGKGPLASKFAIIEFFSHYGSSPEASVLMPEVLKNPQFSFTEKKSLLEMSRRPQMSVETIGQKTNPLARSPVLAFQPSPSRSLGSVTRLSPQRDHAEMRDLPMMIHERMRPALGRPVPAGARFDPTISPDTFGAQMHKGEHIVRHLVDRVRSHSRDEHPVQVISGTPQSARKKVAKKASKKVKKKKPTARKAKKPKRK